MRTAIGVDVGGTKVAGALVDETGKMLAVLTETTPADDVEAALSVLHGVVAKLTGEGRPDAVGVGVAGMVDASSGVLRWAPNLAWEEVPVRDLVAERAGLPCVVDNDANAAAWGEHRFGAGRDYRDLLLVTVGTGIGGGLILDGRLYRGAHGFAAEIGHVIVEPDGPLCGCGNRGCWEQVASGNALGRLGRQAAERQPASLIARLAGDEGVTGRTVVDAAERGDAAAAGIVSEVGRRLGEGIAGLVNVLDPQAVIVGGGLSEIGESLLGPARLAYRRAVEAPEHRPEAPMLAASLGNDAGAIGAAALALDEAER